MKKFQEESRALPAGVQRVSQVLEALGHPHPPRMLEEAARTAAQAADALGVLVGQIVKSIVFRRLKDEAVVLVLTAGDRRVDTERVAEKVGAIGQADAHFVKEKTGFSIGGVSPIGHLNPPVTLIDASLARFETLWAAAGHPNGVFPLSMHDLERMTGAQVAQVTQTPESEGI